MKEKTIFQLTNKDEGNKVKKTEYSINLHEALFISRQICII